jgi:aspartyl/asparaginyl-tRNA synthetase
MVLEFFVKEIAPTLCAGMSFESVTDIPWRRYASGSNAAGGTIFLLLEDEHGCVSVVVQPELVGQNEEVVKRAPFVLVQGRVKNDGAALSVVGKRFKELQVQPLTHRTHKFR